MKYVPTLSLGLAYISGLYGIWLSPLKPSIPSMSFIALAFLLGYIAIRTGQKQEEREPNGGKRNG